MVLPTLAIITSLAAAVLGIRAATYPVKATVSIGDDLRKQGRWSSWAALPQLFRSYSSRSIVY